MISTKTFFFIDLVFGFTMFFVLIWWQLRSLAKLEEMRERKAKAQAEAAKAEAQPDNQAEVLAPTPAE
ncbi:MAG: hypothetical protein ACFB2Z_07200 [Maricaulaceae bacterium]